MNNYVVNEVPSSMVSGNKEKVYYCHHKMTPQIPVFGSIGDKKKANRVCRMMNGR